MSLLDMCRRTARRTFGIERLRREQESAMVAILKGRDARVALPSGFGKPLIYQVPAMILDRPTIVVSPLIALMADQEHTLRSHRAPVVVLYSRLRLAERRAALAQREGGGRLVVLTTPESLGLDQQETGSTCMQRMCCLLLEGGPRVVSAPPSPPSTPLQYKRENAMARKGGRNQRQRRRKQRASQKFSRRRQLSAARCTWWCCLRLERSEQG
jgi:hypothetical protein